MDAHTSHQMHRHEMDARETLHAIEDAEKAGDAAALAKATAEGLKIVLRAVQDLANEMQRADTDAKMGNPFGHQF